MSDLGAAARGEAELTKRSEASQLATAATRSLQPPSCPPAEHDSEDAQRHTDGAESKWRMVLEREADVQTFEQMSELHTTEHRVAAISIAGVLAIMIVAAYCTAAEGSWRSAVAAYCTHVSKYPSMAVEDCPWRGAADSLLDNLACCYGFDGWGHGFGSRNRNYMKM